MTAPPADPLPELPLSDEEIAEIEAGHYETCEAVEFCAKDTIRRALATISSQREDLVLEREHVKALNDANLALGEWIEEASRVVNDVRIWGVAPGHRQGMNDLYARMNALLADPPSQPVSAGTPKIEP